jgi:CRP-like cAMP-binding protein
MERDLETLQHVRFVFVYRRVEYYCLPDLLNGLTLTPADLQVDSLNALTKRVVVMGEDVIKQGDKGDRFYVVDAGSFEVWVRSAPDAEPQMVHVYNEGGGTMPSFGELALMYSKPRAATVRARTDGVLWALDRIAFRSILMRTPARETIKLLRSVPLLSCLTLGQLQSIADVVPKVSFAAGETVLHEGDRPPAWALYCLQSGQMKVTTSKVCCCSGLSDLPSFCCAVTHSFIYSRVLSVRCTRFSGSETSVYAAMCVHHPLRPSPPWPRVR